VVLFMGSRAIRNCDARSGNRLKYLQHLQKEMEFFKRQFTLSQVFKQTLCEKIMRRIKKVKLCKNKHESRTPVGTI
jgi:hypothetical protein